MVQKPSAWLGAATAHLIVRFAVSAETAKRFHLGFLALMFWDASLVWTVDGFFCLTEGEPFVKLGETAAMADDALLGVCVVTPGFVVWGVVNLIKRNPSGKTAANA